MSGHHFDEDKGISRQHNDVNGENIQVLYNILGFFMMPCAPFLIFICNIQSILSTNFSGEGGIG